MIRIWVKERGGFGEEKLHRKIPEAFGVEWSWEVIPFLVDIDHKRYTVRVTNDNPDEEQWDYTWEMCPCCETEVAIKPFGISFCPECGEPILPCSMCNMDYHDCGICPYYATETKER